MAADTSTPQDPNAAIARSGLAQRNATENSRSVTRHDGVSVIGRDLVIIGEGLRIVSQGKIQVDGQIRGDVLGGEVVVGDGGRVDGLVSAERVVVHGTVTGSIRGSRVELTSRAQVDADIYHESLTLEQGALFEGKSRRPQDTAMLTPDLNMAASAPPGAYDNTIAGQGEPRPAPPAMPPANPRG